jgi:hypothetical protein
VLLVLLGDIFTGKIAHTETSESFSVDGELSSLATGCQIKRAGEFLVVSFPLYIFVLSCSIK